MACAIGYVKCMLLLSIAKLLLSGVSLIVMSALMFQEIKDYSRVGDFVESQYNGLLITLMVVGSLTVAVSFYAVLAVARESPKMIITFAAIIFALFICEVTVGSIAFLRSNDIGSNIRDKMRSSLAQYPTDPGKRKAFDAMQENLECCGVAMPLDYVLIFSNASVPASCCVKNTGYMCLQSWSFQVIHLTGCHEALTHYISRSGVMLGIVSLGAALMGILTIVSSIFLVISLMKEGKRMDEIAMDLGCVEEERQLTLRRST